MKNIELGEKLKNRFKELEALIANDLGAEKMEALSNIIHFNDIDDITDIVDDDRFNYDYNFSFKNWATTDDYIKAFKILLDDDIADVKDYLKDLPFYKGEITDEILGLVFGDKDINDKFYYKLREIEDFTKIIIADKYYQYFRLDFIKEFLGE